MDVAGGRSGGTAELFDFEPEMSEDPRGPLPPGPSFSIDDVIDFHFKLEDDRYIEQFLAARSPLHPPAIPPIASGP